MALADYNPEFLPSGGIKIGDTTYTPQDVVSFVQKVPRTQQREILLKYNIDPGWIAKSYNLATGSNYTPEEAYTFYQIDRPKPATQQFEIPKDKYYHSTSRSGINWQSPVASTLLPVLQRQIQGLEQKAEQLPATLTGLYRNLMNYATGPEAMQGTLNQLASRGILNSSVAANTLARNRQLAAADIAQKAYDAQLKGLLTQLSLPSVLANIAGISRETTSETSNPLEPYKLMADMLL